MSIVTDLLAPLVVLGIRDGRGRLDFLSVADSFMQPTAAYDISIDNESRSVIIDFRDSNLVALKLAGDACRLASASFQTIGSVTREFEDRDSAVWALVKIYYAAFYAGNALLRLFGESCSFFDRHHVDRLRSTASAYGLSPTFALETGLYHCVLDEQSTALSCVRIRAGAGGAHESFWLTFAKCLDRVSKTALLNSQSEPNSQSAYDKLISLEEVTKRRAGFSWLSAIRNDLQYRQHYGVWFPAKIKAKDRDNLSRAARAWNGDPMNIDLTVGARSALSEFTAACSFIVALCHSLLTRIAETSRAGKQSFVHYGPMALLHDARTRNSSLKKAV